MNEELRLKAIVALSPKANWYIDTKGGLMWDDANTEDKPTEEEIQAKMVELIEKKKIDDLVNDLKEVHKLKTKEVKDYIADTDLYQEKNDEYNAKETLAKKAVQSGDYDVFTADALVVAMLKGIDFTAEQYAQLIIAKADGGADGDGMKEKRDKALLKMGTFRTYVSALIDAGQFESARGAINTVKGIDAETIVNADTTALLGLLEIGGA